MHMHVGGVGAHALWGVHTHMGVCGLVYMHVGGVGVGAHACEGV